RLAGLFGDLFAGADLGRFGARTPFEHPEERARPIDRRDPETPGREIQGHGSRSGPGVQRTPGRLPPAEREEAIEQRGRQAPTVAIVVVGGTAEVDRAIGVVLGELAALAVELTHPIFVPRTAGADQP